MVYIAENFCDSQLFLSGFLSLKKEIPGFNMAQILLLNAMCQARKVSWKITSADLLLSFPSPMAISL